MMEGARIEFRLLGPLEAVSNNRSIPLGGVRQRALLALLLLHPNEVVARDVLIDGLWGEHPPESAANALAALVARLRRALPTETIATRAGGYEARIESDALDLVRFERLAAEGGRALDAGDATAAAEQLRAALSHWRGPPLVDFTYEPFAEPTIRRLEELRLTVLENRIDADLALGRHGDLVGELQMLVSEHPLRESFRAQLMLALYRAGRQAEALEAYRDGRATLLDELGIDPGPALQELERAILRQDAAVRAQTRPRAGTTTTNLPRPASSFLGREREVGELVAMIEAGARLVTVTGPGGTGKTRLALEAASTLVPRFDDGVFWVGLASLRDSALVSDAIAKTLGTRGDLARYLGDGQLLLLLDNFEQVIEAAPDLTALLEVCPNLTLLVTSRERLRVSGEIEYPVLGLAEAEAVDLFCARARIEADETVAELCMRLDNLPLAVELAAARISALSPEQILERLSERPDLLEGGRDADPRQQTLQATMEWSYELLASDERRLFARLAVFRGGCSLEAAEEVCQADLNTLQSLVDKSLLRHTGERFSMLETIREYAAEQLEATGDADDLRQCHADYFLSLAEDAWADRPGTATGEWLNRLDRDNANFRAALDRLEASDLSEQLLRMAGALWGFWLLRAPAEGWRRIESALQMDNGPPTAARARALNGAVALAVEVGGDEATARRRAEEALALHRTAGDAWGAAYSVFQLGSVLGRTADLVMAQQHYEESARLFRELGDEHYVLLAQSNLAWTCYDVGDRERARALHEGTLASARATSSKRIEAISLAALAIYAVDEGQTDNAISMLTESLRIRREVGDLIGLCADLRRSSVALAVAGRAAAAVRLLSSSETLREQLGGRLQPDAAKMDERTLALVGGQLDEAAFAEAWEQGRSLPVDEAIALSLDSAD
jgi:predicted ATPase/DNA-binding SARP family transcriptional activator